jgi:hypothetical protein
MSEGLRGVRQVILQRQEEAKEEADVGNTTNSAEKSALVRRS